MHIRSEVPDDVKAIYAVHAASFPTLGEARLVDALRGAGRLRVSLVGVQNSLVVGHVAFSPVTMEAVADALGLGPIAVSPAFRRRRIADALVREGLALAGQLGSGFIVVLGEPDYYRRFGFVPARARDLRDEYAGGDAFQVLELRAGAIPAGGGLVRYAPEFALVES